MKLIIVLVVLAAFVASSLALKNGICGQASSVNSGPCLAHLFMWSYDSRKNDCVQFIYGGCGGNDNKFASYMDCIDTCVE